MHGAHKACRPGRRDDVEEVLPLDAAPVPALVVAPRQLPLSLGRVPDLVPLYIWLEVHLVTAEGTLRVLLESDPVIPGVGLAVVVAVGDDLVGGEFVLCCPRSR
jgi:hypothetical protein